MFPLLPLLSFSLLFFPMYTSSSPISLPIHSLPLPPHPNPFHNLAGLASASVLRAQLLKNPKTTPPPTQTPLSSHSYGGYSISLNFGTPPQSLPLLLDTGSQLTWIPCTKSYLCRNCPAAPIFLPKISTSSKLIGCKNPKCTWIHPENFISKCRECPSNSSSSNCSPICPPYFLIYGSGSTAGLLLSETLRFSNRIVQDFGVGCSLVSDRQLSGGIAGFGRGSPSIPAQLNLKRFSYCLISRRYDDDGNVTGALVLDGARDSVDGGVKFTPLLKNPIVSSDPNGDVYSVYYYVGLRKITVGGKKVKIPYVTLVPGSDGNGGVIIDSGTTFTYIEPAVFDSLVTAFVDHVAGRYNRSETAEDQTGLRPCFELPPGVGEVNLPELVFHFKGGAEMKLPLENYFAFAGKSPAAAICLTVVSDGGDTAGSNGPSIILGNFQQQNYYMVYDLERERLGFRQQSCIGS